MAITTDFTDCCEKYAAGDVLQWWGTGSISGKGTNDYGLATTTGPNTLQRGGLTATAGRMVIMRVNFGNVVPGSALPICKFLSGSTSKAELRLNASMHLSITANASPIASDTTFTAAANTWYVVEFGYWLNATGAFQVKIDGVTITALSSTGLDGGTAGTPSTGTGTIDTFEMSGYNTAPPNYSFDFIATRAVDTAPWTNANWWAVTGTTPVLKKKTLRPLDSTAGGGGSNPPAPPLTTQEWFPGAPAGNFEDCINVLPFAMSDARFNKCVGISASAGDNRITLRLQTLPGDIGTIRTVAHVLSARHTGTQGDFYMESQAASINGGNPMERGSQLHGTTTTYQGYQECWDTAPDDSGAGHAGTAWNTTILGQLELGARATAIA